MSQPRFLVYDRGAFLTFAQALATDAEVLYFSEWREVAAYSKNAMVGRDVPGITRVDSFWNYLKDVDVIVFPDVGDGDLQHYLRGEGYKVWGCGKAEILELDRWNFKRLLKSLQQPVVPTRHVIGLDALEKILNEEQDLYIKTSFFRGDFETFHHVNWRMTEAWFQDLTSRIGPHADEIEVLIEQPVKACEIGYDGWCIDGQWPTKAAWGLEQKDSAYLITHAAAAEMPGCIQSCNAALSDTLKTLGMRGCYSNEIRVAEDGTAYLTDPTCRAGAPPSACMSLWITNWVDVVQAGADGQCLPMEVAAPYACEIEFTSQWLEQRHWLALDFPPEVAPWVRLRRPLLKGEQWWCVPHEWLDIGGAAIGLGPTPAAAIQAAVDVADQIDGYQIRYNRHVQDELLESWQTAQETCNAAAQGVSRAA